MPIDVEKIKDAEMDANERIAEAKKRFAEEVSMAKTEAEKAMKTVDERALGIISKAVDDGKSEAMESIKALEIEQKTGIVALREAAEMRIDGAIEKIVEAF